MNILLLAPFLPRPDAPSGNPRAVFDRARLLSTIHRLTVVTFIEPGEMDKVEALQALGIKVHAVVRDPRPMMSGPSLWRKRARLTAGLFNLKQPMLVQEFYDPRMTRVVSTLLEREKFNLILIEHILMAQYIDRLDTLTTPPVVLTEHDVRLAFPLKGTGVSGRGSGIVGRKAEGRRQWAEGSGQKAVGSGLGSVLRSFEKMRWRRYETRQCRRADTVLVPSAEDADVLAKEVPGLNLHVVPFGLAPVTAKPPSRKERQETARIITNYQLPITKKSLLFVGNFDHPPNVDAALWLCSEIMPLVWRARPQVELWLVGKNPTREVQALAGKRVVVTGEVPSVEPYLEGCTLFVAPLRLGGGMRIKLIEAMGAGAAVITTTVGAQGLGAVPGQHLLVADDAGGFASSILQLLGDSALRDRLRSAGQALVTSEVGEKERLERLNSIFEKVVARKQRRSS